MINQTKKIEILKTCIILLILTSSIAFLYGPIFKIKFGGGDNLEWYQEAQERNTFAKIFNFKYSSGRLGPSAYFNPIQLTIWRYMAINYGKQPYPYHLLSILLHLANTFIAFFFVNKFIKNKFFSFLAALSFGIFYLNFQTVGWIAAGICYGLSALFMFSTFFLFLKYFQNKNIFFYISSLLIFFIGTLTKESIIFTIFPLFAYYFIIQREKIFKFIKSDLFLLPYLMLSLPMILITITRTNASAITNNWGGFNFGTHMFYRFVDFFNYLIGVVPASFNTQMIFTAFIFIFSPVLVYFSLKNKNLLFLFIWLILSILIYTFQNFRDIYSLGRYLYLPSIVWFTLLYYMVARIKNLKIKIISSFFLMNYTIILNILLILIKK